MTAVFQTVLSLSLSGSLLILPLLLFRPLYRKRLSKRWQYYIWLVVVARMLIPLAPETNLIGTLFQEFGQETLQEPAGPPDSPSEPLTEVPESVRVPEPDTEGIPLTVRQNLWMVWLLVAAALMVRKITIYQSFGKFVRSGRREVEDFTVLERFGKLLEQYNLKYSVELYTNSFISSPLLIGFYRPRIVLPTADLPEPDFQYTIQHELTHFRRGDMFYKWLVQLTACLHWFNPFVYWMLREVSRNCELSCDEAVIRKLDDQGKRHYGDTLLRAMETGGSYKSSLASVTLKEGKALLKERLNAIMSFKKQSKWLGSITVLLSLLVTVGATAAGAYTGKPAKAAKANEIVYEDGVYYLLLDGAGESDRPSGGVTEGNVGFVLVRKDGYASIGPFDKSEKLAEEVAEQCEFMREEGRISPEDSGRVVELAEKVGSGHTDFTGESEPRAEEYAAWGIQQKDEGYYFQNQRVWIFSSQPVPDQPAEKVYGLTDYGIDAYGRDTILTKSALKKMLENCRTVPEIGESPRFQYLLNLPGESVTLTPRDSLMLFLYDGREETVAYTKEQYAGEILRIKFEADDDSYFFAVTTESEPPTEAEIAEDYRED